MNSNEQLQKKLQKLEYWFQHGDMGKGSDLVCAQCEAEELLELIKAARQELKEAQNEPV